MSDIENNNDDEIALSADAMAPDYTNIDKPELDDEETFDSDDDIDYEREEKETASDSLTNNIKLKSNENDLEQMNIITDEEEDDIKDVENIENDDDDDDDDDDDNDELLKKLDRDIDNDIILKHHPEIIQNNYQEILALCKIIRNDKGIIVDDLHKTYPFITKYEYARVIGMRAKQINNGADPFIKVDRGIIDGYTIALEEMKQKKIPFILARPLPNGGREYWKLQDLELIHF
jgi:DNA-directed RNA polymerase I, II, and III subunit RPABC2